MENKFELSGKIVEIFEPMTFESGFTKREFVIETDEKFPQMVKFTVVKDKVSLIDNLCKGFKVQIKFNVKGNFYKERYYVDLQAWSILTEEEQIEAGTYKQDDAGDRDDGTEDGNDDMPF